MPSPFLLFVAAIGTALALAIAWLSATGRLGGLLVRLAHATASPAPRTYGLQAALLSPTEREFFAALDRVKREDLDVFAKVRVADIIRVLPESAATRRDFLRAFGPIAQKHFDFVLIRRSDSRPIMAIELDDKSHRLADRVARDTLLDRVAAESGLPLVRFPAAAHYSTITIADKLTARLNEALARVNP